MYQAHQHHNCGSPVVHTARQKNPCFAAGLLVPRRACRLQQLQTRRTRVGKTGFTIYSTGSALDLKDALPGATVTCRPGAYLFVGRPNIKRRA